MAKINFEKMATETRNQDTMNLDVMTPLEVVTAMNREDAKVPIAIEKHLPEIARVVEWATASLKAGGRVFYMGAGTSGRLGVLDAAECPPTFGVPPTLFIGLIAGGEKAFLKAVEGAEDSLELGGEDLQSYNFSANDLVIGLAASGRTPYVIGAFNYAKKIGAKTVAITCNEGSEMGAAADLAIEVVVGPEVLTGSTRLKAGTAEKLILNMISTATMVGMGKAYENLMVDVMQTNEKLHRRAERIVMLATGCDLETAKNSLAKADGSAKRAIVMVLLNCDENVAKEKLEKAEGKVRKCIS